jgi:hypothetical protein
LIITALLLSILAPPSPTCAHDPASWSSDTAERRVRHVIQNGGPTPLQVSWIDPQGKAVDQGVIAPGAFRSIATFVGHSFALTDPAGACQITRIGDVFSGSYIGTSRYRPVASRPRWHVLLDQALDTNAQPTRTALATLTQLLGQVEAALPPASLAQVRTTPIFLNDHAGPRGQFHYSPEWLTMHGRTVEMVNAIELPSASVFPFMAKSQPGAVLHELAHGYHAKLSDEDRAEIEATYRKAMDGGLYRRVRRHGGSSRMPMPPPTPPSISPN